MSKFRVWTVLIILAAFMVAAYAVVVWASHKAEIQDVPLAKTAAQP